MRTLGRHLLLQLHRRRNRKAFYKGWMQTLDLVDNFGLLVNVAQETVPPFYKLYSFMVSAFLVQAADSLLKLVSEKKQTTVFSGFASLNDHVDQRTEELERHYYSSTLRTSITSES